MMLSRLILLCAGSSLVACSGGRDSSAGSDDSGGGGGGGGGGFTDDTVYDSLDAVLEPIRAEWELPSLAAAVMEGDDIVSLGTVGLRRADSAASAVTDTDRYHLGSCTKAMTATLVAVLVEDGVIAWDMTMADAFPDMAIHPDFQDASLSMMLHHVGGAWTDLTAHGSAWSALQEEGDVVAQRAALTETILTGAPEFIPESSWGYSNAGYVIVGAVLEARTGRAWEDLMQEHIFDHLGMDSCGFGPPDDGSVSQPWGHTAEGTPVDPTSPGADNPPALGPAGTVYCDLQDWGRFAAAHLEGGRDESTWLDERSWQRLHSAVAQSYAMGWIATDRDWADGIALSHSGSNSMFYSVIWLAPELNRAWLVATNQGDALFATDDVLNALIDADN